MAQVHYYRDLDGTLVDMSGFAPRLQWTAQSKAEEGAAGSWSVTLDDPDGELDILGHRQWFVEDDESEDEDDIIFGGFTGSQTFARMDEDQTRRVGPLARVVTVELVDANSWLSRILMKGSDCQRPVETDVERMTWLLSTSEAGLLADTSTYVDTSGPVNMDKADVRGTYFGQVVGDCSSASGKNFFVWYRKVGSTRTLTIWYGRDTLPDYPSPFYLTNDLDDLIGANIDPPVFPYVFPLSDDAKMVRSPERQYCGNYATYGDSGGATYRHNSTTHALIASYGAGHRDMTSNWPLVKTKAKAQARADRQLLDVQHQDIRITTRVINVPSTQVTLIKAGMRLQIRGTHWGPDDDDWHYARIVTAQPKPHGAGEIYDVDLELVLAHGDTSSGPPAPAFTGDVFAGLQRSAGNALDNRGPIVYQSTYDHPQAGWYECPLTGPITVIPPGTGVFGTDIFNGVTVSQSMVVRIFARAETAGVYFGAVGLMNVRVNGVIVGQAGGPISPGGGNGDVYTVDLRNYHLNAGDVVTIDSAGSEDPGHGGSDDILWTNYGVEGSYLHVGRGTIRDIHTSNVIMVGP